MTKFCGKIIFVKSEETSPGVWSESDPIVKDVVGDVLKKNWRWERSDKMNDDLNISNQISIIADQFIYENLYAIKAVYWMGVSWKVTDVDVQRPRLVLSLGGVWNGYEEPVGSSEDS